MFNEYVYLSNDKVRQFVPSDPSWWSRIRAKKLGGKAGVAGVEVSLEFEPSEAAASITRLQKIHDHIGEKGRWFEEPGLTPGEWVFFEGRIGYQALDEGAVLFCQSGELTSSKNRIVLHGSASSLVGTTITRLPSTSAPAGGYSDPGGAVSVLEAALGRIDTLEVTERRFWRSFNDNARKEAFAGQESLSRHVETLFEEVACKGWFHDRSPFLVGCARVTALM